MKKKQNFCINTDNKACNNNKHSNDEFCFDREVNLHCIYESVQIFMALSFSDNISKKKKHLLSFLVVDNSGRIRKLNFCFFKFFFDAKINRALHFENTGNICNPVNNYKRE